MKCRLLLLLSAWLLFALVPLTLQAEEPYLEFAQGLRGRGYYDYELLYLDQIAQRSDLPADLKPSLLFERAVVHREYAKTLRNPEKQYEQIDLAMGYLEQLTRDFPNDPNSAEANLERAQMVMQKAEVQLFQAKSPANTGNKRDLQQQARELVRTARDVLKIAYEQHDAAYKKYPPHINQQTDPKLYAESTKVFNSKILESFHMAKCTYLEAQSFDANSTEFKQFMNQAATEFESVHTMYRQYMIGLMARAWQGKCYEELGDLGRALGMYDELLAQPGNESDFRNLKSMVMQFKLVCLYARGDYQLVIDHSEAWEKDKDFKDEHRTQNGVAIKWEQARAFEALGDNRNLPKSEAERYWKLAQNSAQQVARFPGEFKDPSTSMMQRIQVKLGGKERKPETFVAASDLGSNALKNADSAKKELDGAIKAQRPEEAARFRQDWNSSLMEAWKYYDIAMGLVNRREDPKVVALARVQFSRVNFFLKRYYDSAVLADHVARTHVDDDAGLGVEAGYLALAAFQQIYVSGRASGDQKADDMRMLINAANLITDRWPQSERANEARALLGDLYARSNRPAEAAEWFSKVPSSDANYPKAQLAAGRAYLMAYASAPTLAPDARPSTEKLAEWKSTAEAYLRNGIEKMSSKLPAEGVMPQELLEGKIALAELLTSLGREAEGLKLLQDDPQSVTKAIVVPDESQRPDGGIQGRKIAIAVNKLLLRTYIGMGPEKLNDARATMTKLEEIVAGDASSDLTDLYVGLGKGLKAELERLRTNGETDRFEKLMQAFESFVDDMFKKQEGQTLGSLSWLGEQYFALGEISTDRGKTATCYERASAAYDRILKRAQTEPTFATAEQLLNVKVRLVHSNRMKKDFEAAEQLLTEVLKERGTELRTQVEGASLYQDWGSNGETKKFAIAINGKADVKLWGWGGIAKRIQQQKNFSERPELIDSFLDARYNVSLCRFRNAQELKAKEKQKELDICAMELVGSASMMRAIPEEKRDKLNTLYRDVLKAAGKTPVDLPRMEESALEAPKANSVAEPDPKATTPKVETPATPPETTPAAASPGNETLVMVIFGALILGGVGVIGWVVMKSNKPKPKTKGKTSSTTSKAPPLTFGGVAEEESAPLTFSIGAPTTAPRPRSKPAAPKQPAAPATSTREASSSTAATGAPKPASKPAARPAARPDGTTARTEGTATPAPKPRPKPPTPPANE